jgi:hypothetical protein
MADKNVTISFTQISEGVIIPSSQIPDPAETKKLVQIMGILVLITWIITIPFLPQSFFLEFTFFTIIFLIVICLFMILVSKVVHKPWIEFDKNIGKVIIWKNPKKSRKIGEYPIEQVKFDVGKSSNEDSSWFNMTMIVYNKKRKQKYVLFEFYDLESFPSGHENKSVAKGLVFIVEKFIIDFLSGATIQPFENKKIKITSTLDNITARIIDQRQQV